jgi:hypothetical protein
LATFAHGQGDFTTVQGDFTAGQGDLGRQFFAGTASSSPVQPTPTKPTKPTTFTASTPHESDRPRKPKEFVVSVPELIVCSQLVSFPMAEHPCGLILLAGTKRPDRFQVRIQFVHEEGRQNL